MFDQSKDTNGQHIYRIISSFETPDFVKSASRDDLCGNEQTPFNMFADVTRRLFPVHSPAATWMSAAFFHEKRASYNPELAKQIENRLIESARFFKIASAVHSIFEQMTKTAAVASDELPDDAFALVFEDKDGNTVRRLPLRNAGEVKTAAAWLCQYRDELTFEDRRQIADSVMSKAVKFGADIAPQRNALERMAGLGACSAKAAAELIESRIRVQGYTNRPTPLQQELQKLATVLQEQPECLQQFGVLTKLASTIDQFDRLNNLHTKYDDVLERPEDVLFGVTEKVAAELSNELIGSALTGNYYKRDDLQRVPLTALGASLGADFVDAVSTANAWVDMEKLAHEIPKLSLGDAETFDAIAAESGVPPFATKSAAAIRIPQADECALAAQHSPDPGSLWNFVR